MITWFRRLLIRFGKALPFALCFVVLISHIETCYGLFYGDYFLFIDGYTVYKPFSFMVAKYFEYDLLSLAVMLTISVAIETCYWNKLAIIYLCINLYERSYFATTEISEDVALLFAIFNIITSGYFTYKGFKILLTHK